MKALIRSLLAVALLAIAAPAATAQAKIPKGTFELVPDANFAAGFDVTGILVEFTDSTMTATQAGNLVVKSKLVVSGEFVMLTDLDGQAMCPGEAKYQFKATEKGFRMIPVEDPCAERAAIIGAITLVKKA